MGREVMKVYLAGPMAQEATRGAVAEWRTATKETFAMLLPWVEIDWLFPEAMGCDHRGIHLFGTAVGDMDLLRDSDIVLAWLDDINRAGTIAEVGIARALAKKIGVLVNQEAHQGSLSLDFGDRVSQFYEHVTQTHHGCDCQLGGEKTVGHLWFPMTLADFIDTYTPGQNVATLLARLLARIVTNKEELAWAIVQRR